MSPGRLAWVGLWLVVLGWDLLLPHIEGPSPAPGVVAILAGALLIAWEGRAAPAARGRPIPIPLGLALAAAGVVSAVLLPRPESLGPFLVAVAVALALVPRVRSWAGGLLPRTSGVGGGLVVLLAALSHFYRAVEAQFHDVELLAQPMAALFRLAGARATADPPFVHVAGVGRLDTLDASLEKLVGHALFAYAGAALALLLVLRGRHLGLRRSLALLGLALAYGALRFVALGLALGQGQGPDLFYARAWTFGTLLPFAGLLAACWRPGGEWPAWQHMGDRRRVGTLFAVAAALGALLAAALGFQDPGRAKSGRILVDERHSNWEWSTIRLDTESYGVQTVYNYSELVRYLGHYWEIGPNFAPLSDSLLAGCALLVLKTPTRPYEDAEVEAVVRFVARGGGLWLVGDHTNVFGMSTNLNKIGRRFGLRLRYDAVIDLRTRGRQLWERPRWFAHPVVRHVPPLLMATSCSLDGPVRGQRVMLGRSLLADELDYSVNTFFGNFAPDPGEPFGSILQSAAVTRGRGRVLVFTDSTIFSNFFMFVRGKPELALGSIAWLMRENRFAWLRPALAGAALVAALAFVLLAARAPQSAGLAALALAALPAFAVAGRGIDARVGRQSLPPAPRTAIPVLAFDRGRTAWELPDLAELPERSAHSYHTFYVWTQRVGWIPATRLFEKCFEGSVAVVLVNPRAHFSRDEVARVESYVRGGGGLVVLDSPHARHSTANALLEPFGMKFDYAEAESVAVRDAATGDSLGVLGHVGGVQGGEAVLQLPDGRAALAVQGAGAGRVIALCGAESFTDAALGTTSEVPTPEQLALYRIVYRVFGDLLRREAKPPAAPAP